MSRQGRIPARLFVVGALAAFAACTDNRSPTTPLGVPRDPAEIQGGNTRVKVKTLQLASNTLRIEGPRVSVSVSLANSGLAFQSGITLQAQVVQGSNWHVAMEGPTKCNPGDTPGFLPAGGCDMTVTAGVTNTTQGVGNLVPGPALFVMRVLQADPTGAIELAIKSVNVNLVATPGITSLTLASTTLQIGGSSVGYTAVLNNPANTLQGVVLQGVVVQGTTTRAAGGLSVTCGSAIGVLPPGTCTINFTATASNTTGGTGTLVPGAATFQLSLIQTGTNTTLDTKSVAVTLGSNITNPPSFAQFNMFLTTLAIEGPVINYGGLLSNPGSTLQGIEIQQWIVQGTTRRSAGVLAVSCGLADGVLPSGSCIYQLASNASNSNAGTGTLVPGAATLEIDLVQSIGGTTTTFDTKTAAVTLASSLPSFSSLVLESTDIPINGGVGYTVQLQNLGFPQTDILVQGEMVQDGPGGTVTVGAGGAYVTCGAASGTLPNTNNGPCTMGLFANATSNPTWGIFVPGPARFVLHLYSAPVGGTQTEFDTKTVQVNLVSNGPTITSIVPTSTSIVLGSGFTSETITISNPGSDLANVSVQNWIVQGSARRAAGGTLVLCNGPTSGGALPQGNCTTPADIVASNSGSGTGTLVPGPATLQVDLQMTGSPVFDTKSIPITLQ